MSVSEYQGTVIDPKTGEARTRTLFKVRYRVGLKQYAKRGFTTRTAARAYEADEMAKVKSGRWTDPSAAKLHVETVYLDWIAAKQVSNRTKADYQELWQSCIAPTWRTTRLQDVTPASVTRWIKELSRKYSPSRVRKAASVFSQIMDWAVADQRLLLNPLNRAQALTKGSLLPKADPKVEKRFLSHDEVELLVEHAGDNKLMLLLMAYTGLRFGEVTALQAQDVDLLRSRLHVRRAWSDVRGHLELVPPKSGKARQVPLPNLLHDPLMELLGTLQGTDSLLFTASKGGPVRYRHWRIRHFNKAVREAGLTGLTPHGLRHTYAALSVQAGANPKVLQQAMGHSDIRLTLDTYGGLFGDDLDALGEGLNFASKEASSGRNGSKMVPNSVPEVREGSR